MIVFKIGNKYNIESKSNREYTISTKRAKYLGKLIAKTERLAIFHNGKYTITERLSTFDTEWKVV